MQGKILDYNTEFKSGLIRGEDGNKYRFSIDDCKSAINPKANAEVDFEPSGDKAVEVYVMTKDTMEDIKDIAYSTRNVVFPTFKSTINTDKEDIINGYKVLVIGIVLIFVLLFITIQ